jgi:superfamily II DNA or RNA helicase
VLVVLKDDQWLYLDQVFPHEDEIFWKEFSVCDPKKVQFVDSAQYGWDGVTRFYNRAKQRLPRPFLAKLKKVCRENGIPYDIVDERQPSKIKMLTAEDVTPDFLPGIIIEDYQIRGIQAMIRSEVGILAYPTGSGKTEIMAGGVKAIEEGNIVILANQKVVLDQIKSRLSLRDVDDGEGIGLFYAGKKPNGESIVVGSVDSLIPPTKRPEPPVRKAGEKDGEFRRRQKAFEQRDKGFQTRLRNAKMLQKYVKNADVLMIDECDLAASKKYKKIFQFLFRGRRRFGFSGTPFDPSKPVQNMIVQSHLGGVIAQETGWSNSIGSCRSSSPCS